jgi:hypothetical protein
LFEPPAALDNEMENHLARIRAAPFHPLYIITKNTLLIPPHLRMSVAAGGAQLTGWPIASEARDRPVQVKLQVITHCYL